MADHLTKRSGKWHFVRRVPNEMAALDTRVLVRITTKVEVADDPQGRRASRVADRLNAELEAYWRGLTEGRAAEAKARYDAARKRARALGFDYVEADTLAANRTITDIMDRFDTLIRRRSLADEGETAAALGGEAPPAIMASTMFDEFKLLVRASIGDFSDDQMRKWKNPRKRAVANLITVIGDKNVHEISRADALDFRTWWQDRVLEEGLQIDTANKDIGHIDRMIKEIDQAHRLGVDAVFSGLRIKGGYNGQRAAYEPIFIQNKILAAGALDELNDEARRILYLMAETGLRLSEACNLTAETIVLTGKVPHVKVRPDGRRMKTRHSAREIPLVGVALKAMRAQPNGFPRYRHRADSLSALVNKFLGAHHLRPTSEHSAYSLRHAFEDRLTAVEAPEKLIASLMGHKYSRPKYGAGPSLEQKRTWLEKIAFKAPAQV